MPLLTDKDDETLRFPQQALLYLLAAITIPVAVSGGYDSLIFGLFLLYALYDLWFLRVDRNFNGRTIDRILKDLRAACGYNAFFIPIGALIAAFTDWSKIAPLVQREEAILPFLIVGLVAASVSTLFIPVQYAVRTDDDKSPSAGLKLCFVVVLFLQKVSVTAIIYAILRAIILLPELAAAAV